MAKARRKPPSSAFACFDSPDDVVVMPSGLVQTADAAQAGFAFFAGLLDT